MIIREIRTFLGPKNTKIEEYIAVDADSGRTVKGDADIAAYDAWHEALKTNPDANRDDFKPDYSKCPPPVYLGIQTVPGAVVNDKGELIGVSPQEIRFPIAAKTRSDAILGFEKGFETFMRNMEERERQRQKDIIVPDEQLTQAINESSKKLRITTE